MLHTGTKTLVVRYLAWLVEQAKKTLFKATLQSIAYQVRDIIDTMQVDAQTAIQVLKVDGGCSYEQFPHAVPSWHFGNRYRTRQKPGNNSSRAAFLAGLSVGYWKDLDELKLLNETGELFWAIHERISQGTTLQGLEEGCEKQLKSLRKSTTNTVSWWQL